MINALTTIIADNYVNMTVGDGNILSFEEGITRVRTSEF